MPMMILSMVVLPAPLGPTSAKRSPGLIWKDAPLKRTRAPKLFSILSTRRIMVPPLTLCSYMKKGPNLRWSLIQCSGGDEGDRTPDLLTASQALSQLSYAPVRKSTIRELGRRCKDNFEKNFRECRRARDRANPRGAWPPHGPYAGRLGAWNTTRPVQQGFPCASSPIIGSDCEAPLPSAPEPCRFTTINQKCPTTHAFSCNRRATYLRFCKRRTHGARGSPIRRSKPAWF